MQETMKKVLVEFLGTFILIFMGCGAIMMHALYPEAVAAASIPVVFGSVVAILVYTFGHIGSAHFNPAVTLALASVGLFPRRHIFIYCLSQTIGACAAIMLLAYLLPEVADYGMTHARLSVHQSFVFEIVLTFVLMLVIMGATDKGAHGVMAGLAIGGTVMIDAYVGGAATGASMNPARSIAPALFAHDLSQIWIYILAPSVGAILAAFTYKGFLEDKKLST